jgi:probable HAF family extracellular repeat protein
MKLRSRWFTGKTLFLLLALALVSPCVEAQQLQPDLASRIAIHRSTSGGGLGSTYFRLPVEAESAGVSISFGRVDFPRSPSGTAYGLNNKGDVVGVWGPISPIGYFASFGYVLKGNTFHDFNYPNAVASGPMAINDKRQIVGYYDPSGDGNIHAFLYKAAQFTNIDYPGSTGGAAYGINNAGEVVGVYFDALNVQHGFIFKQGVYTTIDPPASVSTEPISLNSSGMVVGDYYDSNQQLHGFIYQNGQFTRVDYPGSPDTILTGINDVGQIVGGYGADTIVGGYDWRTPNMFFLNKGQFTPLTLPVDNAQVTLSYAFKSDSLVGFYADSLANLYGYQILLGGIALSQHSRGTK